MEIEKYTYNRQQKQQINNNLKKLKEVLQLNRRAQTKLKQLYDRLIRKVKELERQEQRKSINISTQLQKKLSFQKVYLNNLYNQQLIRNNTNFEVKSIRKLFAEQQQVNIKKTEDIQWNINPKEINFYRIAALYKKSGIQMYRQWKSKISENKNFLLEKVKKYGKNWEKISGFFQNRNQDDIQSYYFEIRKSKQIKNGRWTLRQNIILLILIEHIGQGKWAAISKKFTEKTDVMIRQRYCNILNPEVSSNQWTLFQQQQLLREAQKNQYKWSKIIRENPIFRGKTDNALRRKYRTLLIDKSEQQIRRIVKDDDLAKAIIKNKYSRSKQKKLLEMKLKK